MTVHSTYTIQFIYKKNKLNKFEIKYHEINDRLYKTLGIEFNNNQ